MTRRTWLLPVILVLLTATAIAVLLATRPSRPDGGSAEASRTDRTSSDGASPTDALDSPAREEIDAPASTGAAVTGVVVDEDGAPIALADVRTRDRGVPTGEDGRFRLGELPVGESLTIHARTGGYESVESHVVPRAGAVVELPEPIVLKLATGLVGRILDPDGRPLDEAWVLALRSGTDDRVRGAESTDAAGRYRIRVDRACSLTLVLGHRRYRARRLAPLAFTPGVRQVVPDIRLEAGGAIAARLRDPEDRPVTRAAVELRLAGPTAGPFRGQEDGFWAGRSGVSDREGKVLLPGLESATYRIVVVAEGFTPLVRADLVVRPPETLEVDLRLTRGVVVTGLVVDSDRRPVAGARIENREWLATLEPAGLELPGFRSSRTTSRDDGLFSIGGFREGEIVQLDVSAEGFTTRRLERVLAGTADVRVVLRRPGTVRGVVLDATTEKPIRGADVVAPGFVLPAVATTDAHGRFTLAEVVAGRGELRASAEGYSDASLLDVDVHEGVVTEGLVFRLHRGHDLVGSVLLADSPLPVPGARVQVAGPTTGSARTDLLGRFRLAGLAPGRYAVRVSARNLTDVRREGVTVPATEPLVIRIGRGGTLQGVVRGVDGRPAAGLTVGLLAEGSIEGTSTRTGDDGSYRFERLPAGEYMIRVRGTKATGFESRSAVVTVRNGEETVADLGGPPAGDTVRLRGRILGHAGALRQSAVMLVPAGLRAALHELFAEVFTARIDEKGRFALEEVPPGAYRLLVTGSPGLDARVGMDIEIAGSGDVERDFRLPRGRLAGRVVRAGSGAGVPDATVTVLHPDGARRPVTCLSETFRDFLARTFTGRTGAFDLPHLPVGPVALLVRAEDMAPRIFDVVAVAEPADPLRLEVSPGARMRFRVTDAADGPVPGADVLVFDDRGRRLDRPDDGDPTCDRSGRAEIRLEPGRYRVLVVTDVHAPRELDLDVRGDVEVPVRLEPGATLAVSVRDTAGPVAGAAVRVFRPDGTEVVPHLSAHRIRGGGGPRVTAAQGRAELTGLPAGPWRVTAEARDGRRGEAHATGREASLTIRLR